MEEEATGPQVAPGQLARKLREKDQFVEKEVFLGHVTLESPCGRSERALAVPGGLPHGPSWPGHSWGLGDPCTAWPSCPAHSLGTCGRGSTPGPQSGSWKSPSAAPGLGASRTGKRPPA